MYIDFAECTEVWTRVNLPEESKCVCERDASDYRFMFYALPKPIMIEFIPKENLV